MGKRGPRPRTWDQTIARFWQYVEVLGPDQCWLFKGHTINSGYGLFYVVGGHRELAHRFAFRVAVGPIRDGFVVCHTCDVKLCVNPEHLFAGTQQDNVSDMIAKGRDAHPRASVCKRGHELVPLNRLRGVGGCLACRRIHFRDSYYRAKALGKAWASP